MPAKIDLDLLSENFRSPIFAKLDKDGKLNLKLSWEEILTIVFCLKNQEADFEEALEHLKKFEAAGLRPKGDTAASAVLASYKLFDIKELIKKMEKLT